MSVLKMIMLSLWNLQQKICANLYVESKSKRNQIQKLYERYFVVQNSKDVGTY
ncbi:unnamed protein product [Paramecium sonneborni]|uniref:Uncharacterized protein n=1 Tax=Paramecium sonneborni TaxID=65129 RepID=A0A8S1MUU2_9CILI|nr:unnamed protein product [Paramecium sonneborni]